VTRSFLGRRTGSCRLRAVAIAFSIQFWINAAAAKNSAQGATPFIAYSLATRAPDTSFAPAACSSAQSQRSSGPVVRTALRSTGEATCTRVRRAIFALRMGRPDPRWDEDESWNDFAYGLSRSAFRGGANARPPDTRVRRAQLKWLELGFQLRAAVQSEDYTKAARCKVARGALVRAHLAELALEGSAVLRESERQVQPSHAPPSSCCRCAKTAARRTRRRSWVAWSRSCAARCRSSLHSRHVALAADKAASLARNVRGARGQEEEYARAAALQRELDAERFRNTSPHARAALSPYGRDVSV